MSRLQLGLTMVVPLLLASAAVEAQTYETLDSSHGQLAFQTPGSMGVTSNVAVFDVDGDGLLDLLWTMAEGTGLRLDLNRAIGDGLMFEDGTLEMGLDTGGAAARCFAAGDFDGDGLTDLFVGLEGQNRLFVAQPDGPLLDVTETHLPGDVRVSSAAAVADFDGDGDLDIYVGSYVAVLRFPFHRGGANQLLVNDGSGRFTDRAPEWGLDDGGSALAAAWSDVDEDGDLDLLVINDFGPHWRPNRAFRNDGPAAAGGWTFTDASRQWGFDRGLYGMGVGIIDADRDGHLDYYLTSIGRHVILAGPAAPTLTERTDELGVANTFGAGAHRSSWGAVPIDADGDGYDDLFVRAGTIPAASEIATSTGQVDRLYALGDDARLHDLAPGLFPAYNNRAGRGIIAADIDRDGSVDLIGAASNDATRIYVRGGDPDPVHIHLASTHSGPGAPGARLWLTCGDARRRNLRQVYAGGSLGSAPPPGQEWLPIPNDCGDEAVLHVAWPSGATSTALVQPGATVIVTEPLWLELEPTELLAGSDEQGSLVVTPYGSDGEPLGPGHDLAVTFDDARSDLLLTSRGDGSYAGPVEAPSEAGVVRLGLWLDGARLPATLELIGLAPEPLDWRFYPARLVEGREAVVTIELEAGAEAAIGLEANGEPLAPTASGTGWARFAWTPTERGPVGLQATVDGLGYGAGWEMPVYPPISAERSTLETHFAFGWPGFERATLFTLYAVDDNGGPAVLASADVRLLEDDVELDFTFTELRGSRVRLTPSRALGPGTEAVVEAAGVRFPPIPIRLVTDDADLAAAVSPEYTQIGSYFEGCRADGSDLLVVSVLPRTSENQPLPDTLPLSFDVTGGEVVGELDATRLGVFKIAVRCGGEPGEGRIELLVDGEPSGVETTFRLYEPLVVEVDPESAELRVPSGGIAFGEPARIKALVRDAAGELAGSGIEMAIRIDATETVELDYCGAGAYCVDLYGPPEGAVRTIRPVVEGTVTAERAVVWFEGSDAGDEPDMGAEPDAGDAGMDVAEPDVAGDAPLDSEGDVAIDVSDAGLGDDLSGDVAYDVPHGGGEDAVADLADEDSTPPDSSDPLPDLDEADGDTERPGSSGCGCGMARSGEGGGLAWWVAGLAFAGWRRHRRVERGRLARSWSTRERPRRD